MESIASPRLLLTNLLSSLRSSTATDKSDFTNPLKDATQQTKSFLITLHVLYPHEFLPALDLLDRQLVTRFVLRPSPSTEPEAILTTNETCPQQILPTSEPARDINHSTAHAPKLNVYFVRSAQPPPKRFESATSRFYDPLLTHYEVRPSAWNCSCPAFAFAAFPAARTPAAADALSRNTSPPSRPPCRAQHASSSSSSSFAPLIEPWDALARGTELAFGGLARDERALPPVCKHLLACVLVERCELFKACAEVKEVSADELAGWCAGWGD